MIIGNVIKFGYGTVAVGSNDMLRTLSFETIKPPQEIGSDIIGRKDIEFENKITFEYDYIMFALLCKMLNELTKENCRIWFNSYILDFSNFNERSVEMVKKNVLNAIRGWEFALAC